MSHLHAELSKRRDKRLELASRRREYEVANITKRRKLDEDGVWSWWKVRDAFLHVMQPWTDIGHAFHSLISTPEFPG